MSEQIPLRKGMFKNGPNSTILLANKCTSCGQIYFPKAQICVNCSHNNLEELELGGKGKIFSYTVVHMPSSHFNPPYAAGYIDLQEGLRLFDPLDMNKDKPFKIGMDVKVKVNALWEEEGNEIIGYKFFPI